VRARSRRDRLPRAAGLDARALPRRSHATTDVGPHVSGRTGQQTARSPSTRCNPPAPYGTLFLGDRVRPGVLRWRKKPRPFQRTDPDDPGRGHGWPHCDSGLGDARLRVHGRSWISSELQVPCLNLERVSGCGWPPPLPVHEAAEGGVFYGNRNRQVV